MDLPVSEARYVESAAGAAGLEEAVKDMSVGLWLTTQSPCPVPVNCRFLS